jgi:hypothetical protein
LQLLTSEGSSGSAEGLRLLVDEGHASGALRRPPSPSLRAVR